MALGEPGLGGAWRAARPSGRSRLIGVICGGVVEVSMGGAWEGKLSLYSRVGAAGREERYQRLLGGMKEGAGTASTREEPDGKV